MIKDYQGLKTYFTEEELSCNCCGVAKLDPVFKSQLRALRHLLGKPMILNSACRCTSHNQKVGGHPRSLHLMNNPVHKTMGTIACDVSITKLSEDELDDLISLAWELGWSVGVASSFIHIDRRVELGLNQVRWNYG